MSNGVSGDCPFHSIDLVSVSQSHWLLKILVDLDVHSTSAFSMEAVIRVGPDVLAMVTNNICCGI